MTDVEPLSAAAIGAQLGATYARFDPVAQSRHLALLRQLRRPADVAADVRPLAGARWELTVAATDHPGALSIIAGLLTAWGADIEEGDAFTFEAPRAPEAARRTAPPRRSPGALPRIALRRPGAPAVPAAPRRVLLDVFRVRADDTDTARWEAWRAELEALFAVLAAGDFEAARERVLGHLVLPTGVDAPGEPLYPVEVDIDATGDPDATVLRIRSMDTPGFLFEFASGLATMHAQVVRAEIRTVRGETRDTFWVTDAGGRKLEDPARVDDLRAAVALVKQFTHLLPRSPDPALALRQFGALTRSLLARPDRGEGLRELASEPVLQTLAEVLGVSRFLWEDFLRMQHGNLFPLLADESGLNERKSRERLMEEARASIRPAEHASAVRGLNAFKDREMFRIDLRHITRRIGFLEFSRELADLAEAVVEAAAALAHRTLQARHGMPLLADGEACGWSICALGKFGGRELGFASDVELLFVYAGEGVADGPQPVPNHAYFEAFVPLFRDAIVARQEGIFELDLRLRPYGAKGALATSLEAFRRYYSTDGDAEQFERLALVRLRPVAGDEALGRQLLQLRDAWVYSGAPLDVANLAHLRERQASELVVPGAVNVKYSAGAVVDIEYFTQALQIEVGARDASVRVPGTLEAIELLARGGYLPELLAGKLQEAYGFLRRLIDGLRVVRGSAKDLTLPDRHSRGFEYLARRLYYGSPDDLAQAIAVRMVFAGGLWTQFEELRAAETPR